MSTAPDLQGELLQLKLEYNNQIDEMQAMDFQIEKLTNALAESDLRQVGCENTRRDLEISENQLSHVAAELCEKEIHVKSMSSQLDECSLYIQKFKQLSPTFYTMKKGLAIVDTHVRLLESVCSEKSILTHQLQCTIDATNTMYEQLKDSQKTADEATKQVEKICQEAKKEIQKLEREAIDNKQNTMTKQCEIEHVTTNLALKTDENNQHKLEIENLTTSLALQIDENSQHKMVNHENAQNLTASHDENSQHKLEIEHLTASLALQTHENNQHKMVNDENAQNLTASHDENNQHKLEIEHLTASLTLQMYENSKDKLEIEHLTDENNQNKLEIENLIHKIGKAMDQHQHDSEQIGKTEIELANLKSNVDHNILISMKADEDKIAYKSKLDNEVLVCISQKHNLDTEMKILLRDVQIQRELLLNETSNNDMMEIEITVCRSQLVDMKQKIEQLTARKEEISNSVVQYDDIVEKLHRTKLEHNGLVSQIEANSVFLIEEKGRIDITMEELQNMRSNKEDMNNEIVEMRQVNSKIKEETDELKQNLQILKIEYESACAQNDTIIAQNSVVSETLATMYGDQSQLLSKKNELLDDIADFTQQLNSLKSQTLCVSEQCEHLQKANIGHEEEYARLTSCIEHHSAEATRMTAEICLLKEEDSELRRMRGEHEEVIQQKYKLETDIETLRNLESTLCLDYAAKTDHMTNLNSEIARIGEHLDKCKLEAENAVCIEAEIDDLIKKRTGLLAEKKNHQIEIQQLIKVTEDFKEEKIDLSWNNTNMGQQISTQSETIELLSRNIEANTLVKMDLEQEIGVLTTQLKDLLLSEQKLIHIQDKMEEVMLEKSKIELENEKQQSEHQRITKAIQDMGGEHDALQLRLTDVKLEFHKCEHKMSDILVLIQEQQLKKQQIDMDVDVSVQSLEDSISAKQEFLKKYSDIELEHKIVMQDSESKHSLIIQHYEESQKEHQLNHEKLEISFQQLQRDISVATTHKETIENQTLEKQQEFNFYKNKLLVVDAYSSQMQIVVLKIHQLVGNDGVDSCADSNSKVLGELISLVVSFLEWFETTFIYKLHILSNMMLNSQI